MGEKIPEEKMVVFTHRTGRLEVLVVDENVESGRHRKNWDRERGRRGLVFEEERSNKAWILQSLSIVNET